MNVTERLLKAAEVNHGLQLEATGVQELLGLMQAISGRTDAITRILAVALDQIGGSLDIEADLFSQAENYGIDVNWDTPEEGAVIHVTLTRNEVAVSSVPEDDEAASGGGSGLMPVQESEGGRESDPDTADTNGEVVA